MENNFINLILEAGNNISKAKTILPSYIEQAKSNLSEEQKKELDEKLKTTNFMANFTRSSEELTNALTELSKLRNIA